MPIDKVNHTTNHLFRLEWIYVFYSITHSSLEIHCIALTFIDIRDFLLWQFWKIKTRWTIKDTHTQWAYIECTHGNWLIKMSDVCAGILYDFYTEKTKYHVCCDDRFLSLMSPFLMRCVEHTSSEHVYISEFGWNKLFVVPLLRTRNAFKYPNIDEEHFSFGMRKWSSIGAPEITLASTSSFSFFSLFFSKTVQQQTACFYTHHIYNTCTYTLTKCLLPKWVRNQNWAEPHVILNIVVKWFVSLR